MNLAKSKSLSIIIFSLSLSCAVKEAPSGGPKDVTPPEILRIDPEPGSTGIPYDTKFAVTFSKAMNPERTESAIFLSPVFWRKMKMEWKGKRLVITPPEPLQKDRTYVLTVGAGAEGIHENMMGKSFSYAFSTGGMIDSCSISGRIFAPDGGGTVYDVWAYPVDESKPIDFVRQIPDYATQIDSVGHFDIEFVKPGSYLVIVVDDRNNDLFWDPSTDEIGLPPFILKMKEGEKVKSLVLRPARRDTVTATITRAEVINNRRVDIEFSQPISAKYADPRYFRITASDDSTGLVIEGIYEGESGRFVVDTAPQSDGESYTIMPLMIFSDWGVPFSAEGLRFKGTADADTSGPALIFTDPGARLDQAYQDSAIELTFSERMNPAGFVDAVVVAADSLDTLTFTPFWEKPNIVRMRFPGRIPREKKIEVTLMPGMIRDIAGNRMPDSAVAFSFRLPPSDTVGMVNARASQDDRVFGVLTAFEDKNLEYESRANLQGELEFETVFPGAYRFVYFEDPDGDGKWSPGVIYPFAPSERFSFLVDSVSVRSRWTTQIGEIYLPDSTQ